MNRIKYFIAISAFSLAVLVLPGIASAQYGGNGGYYPNYPSGGNGNYGSDISRTVKNLKNRAKSFEKNVDRADDRWDDRNRGYGNYGGNLESLADQFADATDDLEDKVGRGRNLNNSRDEARRVLEIASQIDRMMYRNGRNGNYLANQWSQMRYDLDVIAQTYGYNYNNRGNRNNRNGRNNVNWRDRVPFPLPF